MSPSYPKPFRTYDELISLLEDRNVYVPDKEQAKKILSDYSYYDVINGTQRYFNRDGDNYIDHISFYEIFLIYVVLTDLSDNLLRFIITIENSLKSKISYRISEQYGENTNISESDLSIDPDDYLNKNNYQNRHETQNILEEIKKQARKNAKKNKSIEHYLTHHNQMPMWILTNCLTFGTVIKFYQIMATSDKAYVAKMSGIDYSLLCRFISIHKHA